MNKTILQITEQDATQNSTQQPQGVSFEQLRKWWSNAGQPREPQAIINFLRRYARLNNDQINTVFNTVGLSFERETPNTGSGVVFLDANTVEKIQKYLASLSIQELKYLESSVKQVKPMTDTERARSEQSKSVLSTSNI